jgi:ABC-type nitrate/sulfonate/bicarbonate transport system substrate-binding protein
MGDTALKLTARSLAAFCLPLLLALPAKADPKPWRHGVIEPKSDAGFVLMAFKRDFAKRHGITLEYVSLKNETLGLRAILSGDLESYEGGPPVVALARGADVKEIGCPWAQIPHLIFARPGIDSLKQLGGKTMATSAPSSLPDLVGRVAVEKGGLAAGSVQLANVGSDADRYRSLIGGVVDAAVISSEYIPIIDSAKAHPIATGREIVPDFMRICYSVTSKTLAERPDDAARFLATEMDAYKYALANKDEVVKLTREATGQKSDDPRAAFMFDEVVRIGMVDPTLPIPADKMRSMQETLLHLGIVPKVADPAVFIDPRPREMALGMVAKP